MLHGRAHGDLHLDNVFIRLLPQPDAASFKLIDLSGWDNQAPLCRDVPHLLLATIGRHLGVTPGSDRRSLLQRILSAATGRATGPGSLHAHGLELLATLY